MDTTVILDTLRNYYANDSTMRNYLGVTTVNDALRRMVYGYAIYLRKKNAGWLFPGMVFKFNDEEDKQALASNEVFLTIICVDSFQHDSPIGTIRMKDRIKDMTADKDINNHDTINAQGQKLGYDPKIRGIFWVSGQTYEDREQGSEQLHKISCLFKMIVGD